MLHEARRMNAGLLQIAAVAGGLVFPHAGFARTTWWIMSRSAELSTGFILRIHLAEESAAANA